MKISAADYFDAICLYKIFICCHELHVGGISRISSSKINREVIKHRLAEITTCPAHHLHYCQLPQIVRKCIDIVPRILSIKTKDQLLVLIKTQVFVLDVI